MEELSTRAKVVITAIVLIVLSAIIIPSNYLNSIDKHEYGFTFNRFTGDIKPIGRTGWIWLNPFKYSVHTIDLRPYQLSITARMDVGNRILNAKLCKFNPEGLTTFIEWHGKDAGDDISNLKEILKCYAFAVDGGKSCPFLTVESIIAPSQSINDKKLKRGNTYG